ncbi:MAG: hypothetical protein K8R60_07050 [Burkholderiales bacterium]|nr:hypothetical protein [Burkholderiales bacterium]
MWPIGAHLDSHWAYDAATKGVAELTKSYTFTGDVKDIRRIYRDDSLGR